MQICCGSTYSTSLSLSLSVCGRAANGKHFCHSGDRGLYRNKRWKDRRGNEVEWEVGDLIDEWAVENGCMCQLYTQPAPDSGSV